MNLISGFIFGTLLGSLTKALADRSLTNKTFFGRSNCEHCHKKLKWFDLIPIFSYLSTLGRCRYCKDKLSLEYLLIEVLMGLLISFIFFQTIPNNILELPLGNLILTLTDVFFKTFIIVVLIIVFLTDIKIGIIPDRITYPATLIALVFLIIMTIFKIFLLYQSMLNSALGKYLLPPQSDYFYRHALLQATPLIYGLISAFVIAFFFGSLIFITKGRGMGGGDFKLGIFMGLSLGFPNSLVAILLAFFFGSVVGIFLLMSKLKHFGQTIPFGPFLSIGGIISIFFGEQIVNWYINYFSRGLIF